MPTEPATGMLREPRATTMLDLILGTVGVACASALPSGFRWFDLRERSTLEGFDFLVAASIWSCCLAAVGLAFVVIGRHATYHRAARPAEWLVIIIAAGYLSLAVTRLHIQYSSASILVARMERGLQAELGAFTKLICTGILFAIIVAYVGVLFRWAGLSSFLRSLLGTAVALLWYWGPCAVWDQEARSLFLTSPYSVTVFAYVLAPSITIVLPPLAFAYWAIFSRDSTRRWTHAEYACMISFVGLAALMCCHRSVRYYSTTDSFVLELTSFVIIMNLMAVTLGWIAAALGRKWIEKHRAKSAEE